MTRKEENELIHFYQDQVLKLEDQNKDLKLQVKCQFDNLKAAQKEIKELKLELENATTQSAIDAENSDIAAEQVEALEEELQAERYNLKCRDDELAEARAEIQRLTQKLEELDSGRQE